MTFLDDGTQRLDEYLIFVSEGCRCWDRTCWSVFLFFLDFGEITSWQK